LKVRLQSFFPASGLAIGMSELRFFFSFVDLFVSLWLPISPVSPFSSEPLVAVLISGRICARVLASQTAYYCFGWVLEWNLSGEKTT
jgi:hypothetical protein